MHGIGGRNRVGPTRNRPKSSQPSPAIVRLVCGDIRAVRARLGAGSRNRLTAGVVTHRVEALVRSALDRGGVIDITTSGAKTGKPRRIEINFVNLNGRLYITGRPGRKRDWLANMKANPTFTVHLKHGVQADITARADEITDPEERRDVMYRILTESWGNELSKADHILPRWAKDAPLVEFTVV